MYDMRMICIKNGNFLLNLHSKNPKDNGLKNYGMVLEGPLVKNI